MVRLVKLVFEALEARTVDLNLPDERAFSVGSERWKFMSTHMKIFVLYCVTLEKGLLCVTFFCDNFIFQMIDLPLPDLDPTLLVLIN